MDLHGGAFSRVGANPQYYEPETYFPFFGDGMVHTVKINSEQQSVSYVNRFVRTPKFEYETLHQAPRRPYSGGQEFKNGLANTALAFHNKKLLSLEEGSMPYAIRVLADGDLAMEGYQDFGGALKSNVTAHPKIDPETGEMIFFGYDFMSPLCTYGVIDKEGVVTTQFKIKLRAPVMIHDMAVTRRYSIILDLPYSLNFGGKSMFVLNKEVPSRFGILPRHATTEADVIWLEHPDAGYGYHTGNTWEDGDYIHMIFVFDEDPNGKASNQRLCRFTFHLPSRTVTKTTIFDRNVEFPVQNPAYVGLPSQFLWVCHLGRDRRVLAGEMPKLDQTYAEQPAGITTFSGFWLWAVSKLTVEGREVGRIVFGDEKTCSECFFVPRLGATAEDSGYLCTYIYDASDGTSSFVVYDAETMSSEALCVVMLPQRIPQGFHGLWVGAEKLREGAAAQDTERLPLHVVKHRKRRAAQSQKTHSVPISRL